MAPSRPKPTLADFLTLAISPILIMALVGSLVFFLLEVMYVGQYTARLQWTLFSFVLATVLIARISMQNDIADRANLYSLLLGLVVWLALRAYVEYPANSPLAGHEGWVNLGLMAIIWWCAHRLTWDCTWIEETVDPAGAGLLMAAGLEDLSGLSGAPAGEPDEKEAAPPPAEERTEAAGLAGWWQRYRRYRDERRRRPRTPGVWVVYFSLAALPLFGLGQSLIPAGDLGRRRYVFWLMGLYLGSGLGLLLASCFLGLRRYLRRRKLTMPAAMAGLWLVMGGTLAAAVLLAGAFLPRPHAEYPLVEPAAWTIGSRNPSPSRWAVKGDHPSTGQGRGTSERPSQGQDRDASPGTGAQTSKESTGSTAGSSSQGSSSSSSGQAPQGDQGQSRGSRESRTTGSDSESKTDTQGGPNDSSAAAEARNQGKAGSTSSSAIPSSTPSKPATSSPASGPGFLSSLLGWLGPLLKWAVFALVALGAAILAMVALVKFLANFTLWARRLLESWRSWWQGLLVGRAATVPAGASAPEAGSPARPFSWYRNPFFGNGGSGQSPEELVCYSFAALRALARERGVGHEPEETPLEFVQRLVQELPGLEADARRLGNLYVRVAYGRGALPLAVLGQVRQFWQRLQEIAEAPLSA